MVTAHGKRRQLARAGPRGAARRRHRRGLLEPGHAAPQALRPARALARPRGSPRPETGGPVRSRVACGFHKGRGLEACVRHFSTLGEVFSDRPGHSEGFSDPLLARRLPFCDCTRHSSILSMDALRFCKSFSRVTFDED